MARHSLLVKPHFPGHVDPNPSYTSIADDLRQMYLQILHKIMGLKCRNSGHFTTWKFRLGKFDFVALDQK
jgi:hypothetical protein